MTASLKHEDLVRELRIDIDKNLESELDPNQCCIYRVPELIRRVNKEAYTPQLISIGPLHHGNHKLAYMEKKKRRYMKSFFECITIEKQDEILNFIKENENNIRNCYIETSKLKSMKYIIMILYDAIFIIEFLSRNGDFEGTSDSFLSIESVKYTLGLDLLLLENQLPFFVLDEIFKLASVGSRVDEPTFMELSCDFFNGFFILNLNTPRLPVKHFTDWKRNTLLEILGEANEIIYDLPCATKLHESGVKFKKIEGGPKVIRHELQLPYLDLDDKIECVLRNVMALEQCHYYPEDIHICNYMKLMDFLIDTEKDVDLLVEHGIISCFARDNASIADVFNKLCRNVMFRPTNNEMFEELKEHCNSPWNKTMATLRRVYFSNLWRGTGTVAAILLLVFTIIQSICSILQVVLM